MATYAIGQTFENTYQPEAAQWCNENNAFIIELTPQGNKRIFQIQAIPEKSQAEIKDERITELKSLIASTDHVIVEMAENALRNSGTLVMPTGESSESYTTILAQRDTWRAELAELRN